MKPPAKKRPATSEKAMKVRKKTMKKKKKRASSRLASSSTKYALAATSQRPLSERIKSIVCRKRYGYALDVRVIVSNVHESVASENLIHALFEKCGKVMNQSFQFDSSNMFQGTIYVAFASRDDAEEAVSLYHNNITLFGKTWELQLWVNNKTKWTRLSEAGSSFSTSRPDSSAVPFASARSVSYHLRSSTLAAGASEASRFLVLFKRNGFFSEKPKLGCKVFSFGVGVTQPPWHADT